MLNFDLYAISTTLEFLEKVVNELSVDLEKLKNS